MSTSDKLVQHAEELKNTTSLQQLLSQTSHCEANFLELPGIIFDYSRQLVTPQTIDLLLNLAKEQRLDEKIYEMATGVKINVTENRPVLHVALRAGATIPQGTSCGLYLPLE